MAFGRYVKPPSIIGRATQYLIGCIAILILLGLLIAYWPAAFAIAGVIVWWSRKSSDGRVANATTSSDQLVVNSPQATQLSSSMTTITPSAPTPVVTIEYSINRTVGRSTTHGTNAVQWASYDDQLEVASYRIEHPMTYWASGKTRVAEASCIEKHLPVSEAISEPKGALGYWPRYENMTPGQRGNYLHWLAAGKQGQLQDIGYAFVYFYGLERRVLIDGKDADLIISEVGRLLRCYPESRSFSGYLSRFIVFAAARAGLKSMAQEVLAPCLEQSLQRGYFEDLLAVILCWFYLHNIPLPASWAFEVARQDVRTTHGVVVDRARDQFRSLFMQKYREQFDEGMMLKIPDRERLLGYHPASPSLLELGYSSDALAPVRIPNVLGIQSQFEPLVQIWRECIEELRAYGQLFYPADSVQSSNQPVPVEVLTGRHETPDGELIPIREHRPVNINNEVLKRKMAEGDEGSRAMHEWNLIRDEIRSAKKTKNYELVIQYVDEGISLAKERPNLCLVVGLLEKEAGLAFERKGDFAQALARYDSAYSLLVNEKIRLEDVERIVKNKIRKLKLTSDKRKIHDGEATSKREETPVGVVINKEALTRTITETAEVSRILGQALRETESENGESDVVVEENTPAIPEVITSTIDSHLPFSNEQLAALDKRYHEPLAELLEEQVWSFEELTKLARRHQFMRSGMLDTINSWAYGALGDEILVEDDNVYKINQSLLGT